MSDIINPEVISEMIKSGVQAFFDEFKKRPWHVVVWLESEHQHCALYISTYEGETNRIPAEFDLPNYRVTEVLLSEDADTRKSTLHDELAMIVKRSSAELATENRPSIWGAQIDYACYSTWNESEFH